jgi:hypothetical protein
MQKDPPYIETFDYVPKPPQCNSCKHYQGYGICAAFPKGIPYGIVDNEIMHKEEVEGQNGKFIYEVRS